MTTKDIKKKPQQDGYEGWRPARFQTHTTKWATHQLKDNYNCRDFPQGESDLKPTSGSSAWGSCAGKTALPQCLALKASRRGRGLWEIETPLLKGTHKLSHALGPRAEEVI